MMEKKLTKGQKNELARRAFQERINAINKLGYSIKTRKCGYGETDTSVYNNGIEIAPAYSFAYESSAVQYIEDRIKHNVPIEHRNSIDRYLYPQHTEQLNKD